MIPAYGFSSRGRFSPKAWVFTAAASLVGGAVFFVLGAGPAFADDALDGYKANLRLQREHYESAMNSLDPVDNKTHKCSDIFKFKLNHDRLMLEFGIPPTPRHIPRRVDLEGVSSPASVTYVASIGRRIGGAYTRFDFSSERYDDNAGTYGRLRILAFSRDVRIMQTWRSLEVSRDVSLEDSGDEVRFNVAGTGIETVSLTEPDFASMRRLHPRETERWLRPMLKELNQERMLAPDLSVAWQALANDWPDDRNARDTLHEALPDLGAADYHTREAAAKRVADLGLAGATAILRLDDHHTRLDLSAEQNRELDSILTLWRSIPQEHAAPLRNDRQFLLDCLSSEDATVRAVALQRLQKLEECARGFGPQDLDGEPDHRAQTVATLRDRVLGATTRPTSVK
jgi:hypothetical protein